MIEPIWIMFSLLKQIDEHYILFTKAGWHTPSYYWVGMEILGQSKQD